MISPLFEGMFCCKAVEWRGSTTWWMKFIGRRRGSSTGCGAHFDTGNALSHRNTPPSRRCWRSSHRWTRCAWQSSGNCTFTQTPGQQYSHSSAFPIRKLWSFPLGLLVERDTGVASNLTSVLGYPNLFSASTHLEELAPVLFLGSSTSSTALALLVHQDSVVAGVADDYPLVLIFEPHSNVHSMWLARLTTPEEMEAAVELIHKVPVCVFDWLIDWLTGWLFHWLVGWLIDWLKKSYFSQNLGSSGWRRGAPFSRPIWIAAPSKPHQISSTLHRRQLY